MLKIRRALLSVSDKTGVVDFARKLRAFGIEILSTGGTAKLLREQHVPVTEVSEITGFPEIMGGRVKTLHPRIHGGLLGRRGTDDKVMAKHDIQPIDMLAVNLYPFERTIADPECDLETAIENIDIGGPAMLRAAAKNHSAVTVVVDSEDYARVLADMQRHDGAVSDDLRFSLAGKAFAHTARYDSTIAAWLAGQRGGEKPPEFPPLYAPRYTRIQDLRYGENPHQRAAFYAEPDPALSTVTTAHQLQGKELSFNNIADADAALECVKAFARPACVIVKHANPCGVASDSVLLNAYEKAFSCDPVSAFGGIIAFNRTLDLATARAIVDRQFVEVIIAPEVESDARDVLKAKKNVRVLTLGEWNTEPATGMDYRKVAGGLLVQERDIGEVPREQLVMPTTRWPDEGELKDLLFAWKVVKWVKSNAIVYARESMTLGIGAGQMSRVHSARIAAIKAGEAGLSLDGAVMASDAFFPFRDSIDAAAEAGVRAIIQPGGSMRDQEVIQAANEHGIAMVFTGMRHFRH